MCWIVLCHLRIPGPSCDSFSVISFVFESRISQPAARWWSWTYPVRQRIFVVHCFWLKTRWIPLCQQANSIRRAVHYLKEIANLIKDSNDSKELPKWWEVHGIEYSLKIHESCVGISVLAEWMDHFMLVCGRVDCHKAVLQEAFSTSDIGIF